MVLIKYPIEFGRWQSLFPVPTMLSVENVYEGLCKGVE
jgi:hypothetical protein